MAVGNLEQNIGPAILAHTVRVKEGEEFSDEIKYFLPYGIALTSYELNRGLREFFQPKMLVY